MCSAGLQFREPALPETGISTREIQLRRDHDRRMRAGPEERDSFTLSIPQVRAVHFEEEDQSG